MPQSQLRSWRHILLTDGARFLNWIDETDARVIKLQLIADELESYLKSILKTREACLTFWHVIPKVRVDCNNILTYEEPLAAEAYAYSYLLDRYWRTWDVLLQLTAIGALPLGTEGIRILDVGTGPAPTAYAIEDFYGLLREFGSKEDIATFSSQKTDLHIIECSQAMLRFIHYFSEYTKRPGPFHAYKDDFAKVDPLLEREYLRSKLLREEYYEASEDEYFRENSPEEVNYIVQRHECYRLVILSYFITLTEYIKKFEPNLSKLFSDLHSGSVVIIIGGHGKKYEKIYEELISIAKSKALTYLAESPKSLGETSYPAAARVIKRCQYNVYRHLEKLAGSESLEKTRVYPDYWNIEPSQERRSKFGLRLLRKGRWPRSHL